MKITPGDVFEGGAGTATEVLYTLEPTDRPDLKATVGCWFFHCPHQSPAWDNYVMSVIHLRPIEGVKPAHIRVPGATHELLLGALDPEREPRIDNEQSWSMLRPMNLMEQFAVPDDGAARHVAMLAAKAVVIGMLWAEPPLSGQVEPWRTVLANTAAHFRGEEHEA